MKAVILAGGLGTRISEETQVRPKPMVEIGGKPILWHLMKIYAHHGVREFIVCLGYKGYVIKEYFANYFLHTSDVTFDLATNTVQTHRHAAEPWKVTLVDTGETTQTGGRLKRVRDYVGDEDFCFTYGDGLANVDIRKLIEAHRGFGTVATVTSVQPPGRWGVIRTHDKYVTDFQEKPEGDGAWVNGGFFVLSPKVFEYIQGDDTVWERGPIETLARSRQLAAYTHRGFWQPMDHMRDKQYLDGLWAAGTAPWKVWE
jgi:glucose-1-phosphate cytidylyltransferase